MSGLDARELAWARSFIASRRWREAVTMPENPHEYVRRERGGDEGFDAFCDLIAERGWSGEWRGRAYRYLTVDAHSYWWMPPGIVNRKPAADVPGPGARTTPGRAPAEGDTTTGGSP